MDMSVFDDLSKAVPWDQLEHAGGSAGNTPTCLLAAWAGERAGLDAAQTGYSHLWSDLLGGGRVWSATAPAAYLLALLIRDDEFGEPDPTLRQGVLVFFRELAVCVAEPGRQWVMVRSINNLVGPPPVEACQLLLPDLFQAAITRFEHPDARTASCAATAAVVIARSTSVPEKDRSRLVRWLEARARSGVPVADRASALIDLGDLGYRYPEFLVAPHPALRFASALAPAMDEDSDATDVLLELAGAPADLDGLLAPPDAPGLYTLPQLQGRWVSDVVAECVCLRVADLSRLLPSALATLSAAASTGGYQAVYWYLEKVFPNGLPHPENATAVQRQVARVVVENAQLWNSHARLRLFQRSHMPMDDQLWRAVANFEGIRT